jgi:hypothetical protein
MSVKNLEVPVVWKQHRYPGIKELGFNDRGSFVVNLHTTPSGARGRGGYFTSIPISDAVYHQTHQTRTMVEDFGRHIIVYDDWGSQYRIAARRAVLKVLLAECHSHNVPFLMGLQRTSG